MEGSGFGVVCEAGFVQIITDPDPGGTKTYGSGFGTMLPTPSGITVCVPRYFKMFIELMSFLTII
jgi:hypothetical protein